MPTVLVVDDNPDLCNVLVRILTRSGYRAGCAMDGADALASIRAAPPAAVILDVMMPDVSGFDVLAAVRADPATAGVPIIMYTADGSAVAERRARALGATAFLRKGRDGYDQVCGAVARHAGPALPSGHQIDPQG